MKYFDLIQNNVIFKSLRFASIFKLETMCEMTPGFVRALSSVHSGLTALSAFLYTTVVKHKRARLLFSATLNGAQPDQ